MIYQFLQYIFITIIDTHSKYVIRMKTYTHFKMIKNIRNRIYVKKCINIRKKAEICKYYAGVVSLQQRDLIKFKLYTTFSHKTFSLFVRIYLGKVFDLFPINFFQVINFVSKSFLRY